MGLNKSSIHKSSGMGHLTLIVFTVLFAAAAYSGYHIFPWYYEYLELESHFSQLVRSSQAESDIEIRKKLYRFMRSYDMPIGPNDVRITRKGKTMSMDAEWERTFSITINDEEIDIHTFEFHAHAEGEA